MSGVTSSGFQVRQQYYFQTVRTRACLNKSKSFIFEQVRQTMLKNGIGQHDPLQWDKVESKMQLDPPVYSESIPSTSGDLGGVIMQSNITSPIDAIKIEPDNYLIDYEVELVDAVLPNKDESESCSESESSIANHVSNTSTVETVTQTVPEKIKRKERRMNRTYSESYLEETINQIRNGILSTLGASKLTGIPRATLQYRLSSGFKNKGSPGPNRIFSVDEENEISNWIKDMIQRGFPITRNRIGFKVSNFLNAHPKKTPFKDNQPGYSWIKCFAKRNPGLSITHQMLKHQTVNVSEQDVRNWFRGILSYLANNQLVDILEDPSRILISNEAGFYLHLRSKVIVDKFHQRNVSFIETSTGDHNITVMFTFVANGNSFPPKVIAPMNRFTQEIKKSFPSDWILCASDNGWMDVSHFTLYIKKVLYPTLVKQGTQFPVLYFVDGHKSNVPFEASDMCKQYGIILIALYPNVAHIIDQSNESAFKKLKTSWDRIVRTWRMDHSVSFSSFGSLLKVAMDQSLNKSTITKQFSVCGLYPFNSNAISYKAFYSALAANPEASQEEMAYTANNTDDIENMPCDSVHTVVNEDEAMDRKVEVSENVLKTALKMLSASRINMYQTTPAADLSPDNKILSYVYKNILVLGSSPALQECDYNPSTVKTDEQILEATSLTPDNYTESLEFDLTMDIKIENDSEIAADMTLEKETSISGNCQQNEINSNSNRDCATSFAKEHICSFPRITIHSCPVAKKTKYHSCFLDLTGMYIAYLEACHKSSQEPISSKLYNEILLNERTNDPPLPSRCDDCQYTEKFDLSQLSPTFFKE